MAQTNHWPIESVLCKEFSGDIFKICILTNIDDSGQMGISHLRYKEVSIITRNILGLEGIVVLLGDMKSAILNILVYTTSL